MNSCHGGKVSIPPLHPLPKAIYNLFTADTEEARDCREYIYLYNSFLGFASMGANLQLPPGYGLYCYQIDGQITTVLALYTLTKNEGGNTHNSTFWRAIRH